MVNLHSKKILFIGIGFYDYEDVIKQHLEARGAQVAYIVPHLRDKLSRLYCRLNLKSWSASRQQKLRTPILESAPKNNDIVFIIKGDGLTQQDINLLKLNNPTAHFILYLWDSLIRHDNADLLLSNFSNIFSFDRVDCQNNPRLQFRPLYYRQLPVPSPKEYDLSFIGFLHSDRLQIARTLRNELVSLNKKYYIKLYGGRFSYFKDRFITRRLSKSDREFIIFKSVPYSQFQQITASSRVVLDVSHPLQSGLTIRTIETLAAGCHLLTTNADIANYGDIDKQCYTIFDRSNPVFPTLNSPVHCGIDPNYSLDSFINQLFKFS